MTGDHHADDIWRELLNGLSRFQAAQPGHQDVGQQQVEGLTASSFYRLQAIVNTVYLLALRAQGTGAKFADVFFIIGDENLFSGHRTSHFLLCGELQP